MSVSITDYLKDRKEALAMLRRIDDGDDSVLEAIRPFLKRIDARDSEEDARIAAKADAKRRRQSGGRMNSGNFEVEPRMMDGVDYGATGLVLARCGGIRLVWRSGSKYYSGIGVWRYAPACLEVMKPGNRTGTDITDWRGDGKKRFLTKKIIMDHAASIDAHLGAGAAAAVAAGGLKATVVLEND